MFDWLDFPPHNHRWKSGPTLFTFTSEELVRIPEAKTLRDHGRKACFAGCAAFACLVIVTLTAPMSAMVEPSQLEASLRAVGGHERPAISGTNDEARALLAASASARLPSNSVEGLQVARPPFFRTPAWWPTIVTPVDSIQKAIDAARPGATIWVLPGVYEGPLTIHKPLRLLGFPVSGPGGVVLIPPEGGAENGISVLPADSDSGSYLRKVVIAHFTVWGFEENGIYARQTDGLLLLGIRAIDNGEYGLYPVLSRNGIIAHSEASGSADAGIYVGQSVDFVIQENTTHANVVGVEVSNSRNVVVTRNTVFDNSIGVLAALLPPSERIIVADAADIHIHHNHIISNNHPNFAGDGEFASAVPAGSGVVVLGCRDTLVAHNKVFGNAFAGVAVASTKSFLRVFLLLRGRTPEEVEATLDAIPNDLDPGGVQVRDNAVFANGTLPESPVPPGLPGVPAWLPADLLWDGTGTGNCWADNIHQKKEPASLPACHNAP